MEATRGSALLTAPASAAGARLGTAPCEDPAVWNALARTVPGGSAFHDWSFLDLQERVLGIVIERHLLLAGDRPVGVLPLARRNRRSLRAPWLPFPQLGPALAPDLLGRALPVIRGLQRARRLLLARFELGPALAPAAGLLGGSGVVARRDGTVVLDLTGAPDPDAMMTRSRRQGIRRALRNGVEARPALRGETATVLQRVTAAAYARRGAGAPYPEQIGAEVERWAEGRDDVFLGAVVVGGEPVGSTVLLGTHPVAAGWLGACSPGTADAGAVLTRAALLWAVEHGYVAVDFGGRVCDEVERYKLSFGGHRAPTVLLESLVGPAAALVPLRRRRPV